MARSAFQPKPHADILRTVFDLSRQGMTRPLAEGILNLDFPDESAARLQELSLKANEGTLTEPEEIELEAYVNVSDLLAYWQSKARQVLQSPS